jgi:hypothetical protein
MIKVFRAKNESEANAKADAWIGTQKGLENMRRHSYLFRTAFLKPNTEGEWSVSLHYDQESSN